MRVSLSPKLVLFDVDGTMVDSVPDLTFCIDSMLTRLKLPEVGGSNVRNWVGNGVVALVRRALARDMDAGVDADQMAEGVAIFMELYQTFTCRDSRLYEGVESTLIWLKEEGYALGCVTNKDGRFARPLLEILKIDHFFEIIICGDTLEKKKPDPAPLLHAAKFFDVSPQDCLMIGDSISDVKAARNAGFQIVCMSYGYNHGQDIRETSPDAVIDSMVELKAMLKR